MKWFLNYIVEHHYIKLEDKDIYQYGILSLLFNVMTLFSVVVVSLFFNKLIFSIWFIFSFVPIRMTLGGYHCKNPIHCIVSFNLIYIVHVYALTYVPNKINMISIILIIILMALPPHIHENKKHISIKSANIKKNKVLIANLVLFMLFAVLRQPILVSVIMNFELYMLAVCIKKGQS